MREESRFLFIAGELFLTISSDFTENQGSIRYILKNTKTKVGGAAFLQSLKAMDIGYAIFLWGRIGNDNEGEKILKELSLKKISTNFIQVSSDVYTGFRFEMKPPRGSEPISCFDPGACMEETKIDDNTFNYFKLCDALIINSWIPDSVIKTLVKAAKKNGIPSIIIGAERILEMKNIHPDLFIVEDLPQTAIITLPHAKICTFALHENSYSVYSSCGEMIETIVPSNIGDSINSEDFLIALINSLNATKPTAGYKSFRDQIIASLPSGSSHF